ncbi:MAG: hypothetical protein ACU85U_07115 [Gammaproteobacteria bacterium]|jgi:hypothetical protein
MTAINFLSPVDAMPSAASGPDRRRLERLASELVAPGRSAGYKKDRNVRAANLDESDTCREQQRYLPGDARPDAAEEALAISMRMHERMLAPLYKLYMPPNVTDAGFSIGGSWRKPV